MFIYLAKNKANYSLVRKEGQIAPLLIAILAILIMITMVSINIGKMGIFKTRSSNAADAGALAAASAMSMTFDGLVEASESLYGNYKSARADVAQIYYAATLAFRKAVTRSEEASGASGDAAEASCKSIGGYYDYVRDITRGWLLLYYALQEWVSFRNLINEMRDRMVGAYDPQKEGFDSIVGSMEEAAVSAKEASIGYAMGNIGISDPDYESPESPKSSYEWKDGQDRIHRYEVEVSGVGPPGGYTLYVTNRDKQWIDEYHDSRFFWAWELIYIQWNIFWLYSMTILDDIMAIPAALWPPDPTGITSGICKEWREQANIFADTMRIFNGFWLPTCEHITDQLHYGFLDTEGRTIDASGPDDIGNNIIAGIKDAEFPRSFSVKAKQSHTGADLGLWETEYSGAQDQNITSSSSSTFRGGSVDSHSPSESGESLLTGVQ